MVARCAAMAFRMIALLACLVGPSALPASADTLYVVARRVITMNGDAIDNGRIIVKDGTIDAVGKDLPRPPFSKLVDAGNLVVTPGFVLAGSDIGMPPAPPGPTQEGVRLEMKLDAKAADEFVPRRLDHALLLDCGITTIGLLPVGDAQGIPGQASAVSTRALTPGAVISAEAALVINGSTHAQWRKAVGDAFEKARKEHHDRLKSKAKAAKTADDAKAEAKPEPKGALAAAFAKKRPILAFVEGLGGWTALRDTLPLAELDTWVLDGADLYTDAKALKELGVRVLTFPVLSRERDTRFPVNRAARWKDAGVPFAFVLAADDAEGAARLRDHVVELVRTGLPADAALAALTTEPAAALGLSEKVGSIQRGRRADMLFWSADPLEPTARLERILVGGETIDRQAHAGAKPAGAEP